MKSYVQSFVHLEDWKTSVESSNNFVMLTHTNNKPSQEHVSWYNRPQSSEVDKLITGAEDGIVWKRDIFLRRRDLLNANENKMFDSIPIINRAYDPFWYVVLLPYSTDGCHLGRRCQVTFARQFEGNNMSSLMFYTCQLFRSPGQFHTIIRNRLLFQQCVVDQCCKVESERLTDLQNNQQKIWSVLYWFMQCIGGLRKHRRKHWHCTSRESFYFTLVTRWRSLAWALKHTWLYRNLQYCRISLHMFRQWNVSSSGKRLMVHCYLNSRSLIDQISPLIFSGSKFVRWWNKL